MPFLFRLRFGLSWIANSHKMHKHLHIYSSRKTILFQIKKVLRLQVRKYKRTMTWRNAVSKKKVKVKGFFFVILPNTSNGNNHSKKYKHTTSRSEGTYYNSFLLVFEFGLIFLTLLKFYEINILQIYIRNANSPLFNVSSCKHPFKNHSSDSFESIFFLG